MKRDVFNLGKNTTIILCLKQQNRRSVASKVKQCKKDGNKMFQRIISYRTLKYISCLFVILAC